MIWSFHVCCRKYLIRALLFYSWKDPTTIHSSSLTVNHLIRRCKLILLSRTSGNNQLIIHFQQLLRIDLRLYPPRSTLRISVLNTLLNTHPTRHGDERYPSGRGEIESIGENVFEEAGRDTLWRCVPLPCFHASEFQHLIFLISFLCCVIANVHARQATLCPPKQAGATSSNRISNQLPSTKAFPVRTRPLLRHRPLVGR